MRCASSSNPFGLSLSKPQRGTRALRQAQCERGAGAPFGLSLSKPWWYAHKPFDKLRANGL